MSHTLRALDEPECTQLLFSPAHPPALYYGKNVLFKTASGGRSWQKISPDLSRPNPGKPANFAPFDAGANPLDHRGVIYSVGPSYKNANAVRAGTLLQQ